MDSKCTLTASSPSSSIDDEEIKTPNVDKFFTAHPVVQTRRTLMAGWTCGRALIAASIIAVFFVEVQAEMDGPCMGCRLFNEHHRLHPEKDKKVCAAVVMSFCMFVELSPVCDCVCVNHTPLRLLLLLSWFTMSFP